MEEEAPRVTGDGNIRADDAALLDELTTIVSRAAGAVLAARARSLDPRLKADRSPVTLADHVAEAVILEGLARVLPGLPVISEEAADALPANISGDFALVDPLDGTRELVAGRDEFTINLALLSAGRPRLGIIAAPAQGLFWRGIKGKGADRLRLTPGAPANAFQERIAVRTRSTPASGFVAAVSRSHFDSRTESFLARLPIAERLVGGSAIKFCQIAEGMVDIYPRLSTTCEWDVAAGEAIVAAAGGSVTAPDGAPLTYAQPSQDFRIAAFIAWGDPLASAKLGG
jgi:3'(2'), 5'-bisphosphate nucleotidase